MAQVVMADVLWIIARGFIQVGPVAASTVFIARGRYIPTAGIAFLISAVWWMNAGSAAHLHSLNWACAYALGATAGTIFGMYLARRVAP